MSSVGGGRSTEILYLNKCSNIVTSKCPELKFHVKLIKQYHQQTVGYTKYQN